MDGDPRWAAIVAVVLAISDAWTVAVGGALGGGAIGWVGAYVSLRRLRPDIEQVEADTAQSLSTTALALLGPYREQVVELRAEIAQLHARLDEADRKLAAMLIENRELRVHVANLESMLYRNE